jgi:3-deoxy-D-manno-octulosonic-acid transferase
MFIYSSLLLGVLVLGAPYWLVRMATSGRYRTGLPGRLGRVPRGLRAAVIGRQVVWVHAVSVGEVLAAARLVTELEAELEAQLGRGWTIVVSTTTATGQALARERFGAERVFFYPLDLRWAVRAYLKTLKPKMVVLMESELWPRLIDECAGIGTPVVVANARISDRSFPRYLRLRRLWRPFLEMISLFLAQSSETAERLVQIGAPAERVTVMGNLKYDVQAREASQMTRRIGSLLGQARLIVAGSTLPGEEEALLAAWPAIQRAYPDAALLIAPRHPDRFEEVFGLIRKSGAPFFRCSQLLQATETIPGGTVLLLDTIGDLASMYGIATVAFVGGSLVAKGGHNPLEPAQFGVPVVMGSSYENFREVVERMREEDGILIIRSRQELDAAVIDLLTNRAKAAAIGERGREVFDAQAGATARTVQAMLALLEERRETGR